MSETDLGEVWARSLDELSDLNIEPHQRAWLRLTRPLGLVENTALIATPNEFVKEQLETRLRALVTHALSRELGRNIQLAVTVDPAAAASPPLGPGAPPGPGPALLSGSQPGQPDGAGESVIVPMPREAGHPGLEENPGYLTPGGEQDQPGPDGIGDQLPAAGLAATNGVLPGHGPAIGTGPGNGKGRRLADGLHRCRRRWRHFVRHAGRQVGAD